MKSTEPKLLRFGRETCGDLARAESLEWLVTNGIGGYASGTVAGPRTRRYHGLLVAALEPPTARTVMVAEVHELLRSGRGETPLHASRWRDGSVIPRGFEHLEAFWLEGRTPVWRFSIGEHCLEKRIVMVPGRNVTLVLYRLVRGRAELRLEAKVLAAYRDYHKITQSGGWSMEIEERASELRVIPFEAGRVLRILGEGMTLTAAHSWYEGFLLARERDRGLDYLDDALHVATAAAELDPGGRAALIVSAEPGDYDSQAVLQQVAADEQAILERYRIHVGGVADEAGARLALAADQFLVRRAVAHEQGATIIAGYHWFTDWGRDTMIALPGLALYTGRPEVAREVLTTFARFVDRGMLPNRFPDSGAAPEYNTVDAALWYIEAVRSYVETTGDVELVRELWPVLEEIIRHHELGTRFGIVVDERDGLLRSGEAGVQLTWMDAKIGDWVVTPRIGKCVEINALWFNGLMALAGLAARLGRDPGEWQNRAEHVRVGFQRFWCAEVGYLYDVIDGPGGDDSSLRPNQVLAVALPASPLDPTRQRAVVEACADSLVTSHGLRSLAPAHADYQPSYIGDPAARDGGYHQGTVWAWLLGPFALAHHRVFGDARQARSFLEPLIDHLHTHGVGTIAEIFDGDPPHQARGCIAQAWSVAEILRAWTQLRLLEPELEGSPGPPRTHI